MRHRDQILAEVLDSLIRQEDGPIPAEITRLAEIGLRLHNECPDADPAFLDRLSGRLQAEMAVPRRVRRSLQRLLGHLPGLAPGPLRLGAAAALAVALLLALAATPGLRSTAQASLSHVIAIFQQANIEQRPRQAATPLPAPVRHTYDDVLQAQAAASFALRTPAYVPDGLALEQVEVLESEQSHRVLLRYTPADGRLSVAGTPREMIIQEFEGTQAEEALALQAGFDSAEQLQIAGRPALWVGGYWAPGGRWVQDQMGGALLVQDGDVLIQVRCGYSRAEAICVAESMFG